MGARSRGSAVDGGPGGPALRHADGGALRPAAARGAGPESRPHPVAVLPADPARRDPARDLRAARGLRLRGREAAGHEPRAVDAARDLHPERDRHHPLLHPARPGPAPLPLLRDPGEQGTGLLRGLRDGGAPGLSPVPAAGRGGLAELRPLRRRARGGKPASHARALSGTRD